jgi:hypothetical protein
MKKLALSCVIAVLAVTSFAPIAEARKVCNSERCWYKHDRNENRNTEDSRYGWQPPVVIYNVQPQPTRRELRAWRKAQNNAAAAAVFGAFIGALANQNGQPVCVIRPVRMVDPYGNVYYQDQQFC